MIPKSCRPFGQDHATEQILRAKSRFNPERFRSSFAPALPTHCARNHEGLRLVDGTEGLPAPSNWFLPKDRQQSKNSFFGYPSRDDL
jgi:hypothetical protein